MHPDDSSRAREKERDRRGMSDNQGTW